MALKVMTYIINWQSADCVKYYERQFSKFLHLSIEEVELSIQTLIDRNLVSASRVDQGWVLSVNVETVKKYFNVPMQKVHDHEGFNMAEKVTWNVDEKTRQIYSSIEDMSDDEVKKLILRLEASLSERAEIKKLVKDVVVEERTDLPF